MKNKLDGIILQGLLEGETLHRILRRVSDETGLELCMYSLNLHPALSLASPQMQERFKAVFSQMSENGSGYTSFTVIRAEDGACAVVPVTKGSDRLGLLALFSRACDESDITYISDRLSKLCSRLATPDSLSSTYSDFEKLWASNLLLNTNSERELVASNPLISRLRGGYAICAIKSAGRDAAKLKYAEGYVETFLHSALHIVKDNSILVFLYNLGDDDKAASKRILERLGALCGSGGLTGGLSTLFCDVADKNRYIEEALRCLELATEDSPLAFAGDMYLPLFFANVAETWGADTFGSYHLQQIRDYDVTNGTEYYATVRAYLLNHGRVLQAASSLYIDHSTLLYRLKKVSAIFEIDFSSPNAVNALRLGIFNCERGGVGNPV